jgi:hypothetical protein
MLERQALDGISVLREEFALRKKVRRVEVGQ